MAGNLKVWYKNKPKLRRKIFRMLDGKFPSNNIVRVKIEIIHCNIIVSIYFWMSTQFKHKQHWPKACGNGA
ncbi:MAG: hypothetical protein B0W54_18560 [Cellvibrio sp. 79]|nr:MAG: hypothetical protein B0W54_18560 [Cellvibrio sp. 79]